MSACVHVGVLFHPSDPLPERHRQRRKSTKTGVVKRALREGLVPTERVPSLIHWPTSRR
jgi:hypothetical protein